MALNIIQTSHFNSLVPEAQRIAYSQYYSMQMSELFPG